MQGVREHTEGSGELTGIERLQGISMAFRGYTWGASLSEALGDIAGQIKREMQTSSEVEKMKCDPVDASMSAYDLLPADERAAIAWVREHGGISEVKEEWNHSRNLKRSLETAQAKVERQQRHIEFVQRKCRERQERVAELSSMFREADYRRVELCSALGIDPETGWADAMVAMHQRLMPEGMEWPTVDGKPVDFTTGYEPSLGVLEAVSIYSNGACEVMGHDGIIKNVKDIHVSKPKVLDVDGVEIELGDDLYSIEGGLKFHVSHIDRINGKIATDAMFSLDKWADPSLFTHRTPVIAADGRPLREGETVWDKDSGDRLIVGAIEDGGHTVTCRYADLGDSAIPIHGSWSPCNLTHERPDSYDALWEDIENCAVGYEGFMRRAKALAGDA